MGGCPICKKRIIVKKVELTFSEMVAASYDYDREYVENDVLWKKAKELYYKNYLFGQNEGLKIPKKIHQIWLGGEIPEQFKALSETWKKYHPDWEYTLWGDLDISKFSFKNRELFDKAPNMGMKSDILRYEILYNYGGLYIDTDFECLKPFDDLNYLEFFTGIGYDKKMQLYNGLIASVPKHDILKFCIDNMYIDFSKVNGIATLNFTGANHFTKAFFRHTQGKVVAFPFDFFYPFPNTKRKYGDTAKDYVKDFSYALHYWAVSWIKTK